MESVSSLQEDISALRRSTILRRPPQVSEILTASWSTKCEDTQLVKGKNVTN